MTKKSVRIPWIDAVKMFAMLCVILGHSNSCLPHDIIGFHEFNMWIVVFNMPLFVIISGFIGYNGVMRINAFFDLLNYIEKISERIAIPTFGFTILTRMPYLFLSHSFFKLAVGISMICMLFIWYLARNKISDTVHKVLLIITLVVVLMGISNFWLLNMILALTLAVSMVVYFVKDVLNITDWGGILYAACFYIFPFPLFHGTGYQKW